MSSGSSKVTVSETARNRSQILAMNSFIPIRDYQPCADMPGVWRGRIVEDSAQSKLLAGGGEVFFTRINKEKPSEIDRYLEEWEITNLDVLGYPFLLISKEKCLFLYAHSSVIELLPGSLFGQAMAKPGGRRQ